MSDCTLTAQQAFDKAQDQSLLLLDIRRPDEWKKTGIGQGATALEMDDPEFLTKLHDLTNGNKQSPIGIVCAAGGRSARVCQALRSEGYDAVFDVSEGMNGGPHGAGWVAKNLPTTPLSE